MTWSYRVIHYKGGGYGLHEVFYDAKGKVENWTEEPIDFTCWNDEGPQDIIASMKLALKDAIEKLVLEEVELEGA